MGFNKEEQTQMCFVVPKIIAEDIDDLSIKMGISRSQYLRKGVMEFHNYQKDLRKRHQESKSPV